MNLLDLLRLPLRYRPWVPRHIGLTLDSARGVKGPALAHEVHLAAAIDWLCRAQDVRNGKGDAGGVSAGWSFEDGWLPSYPETTGYIIETMLAAARVLGRPELVERARRMIDWELSIQLPDGAFPGHFGEPGSRPVRQHLEPVRLHALEHRAGQVAHPRPLSGRVHVHHVPRARLVRHGHTLAGLEPGQILLVHRVLPVSRPAPTMSAQIATVPGPTGGGRWSARAPCYPAGPRGPGRTGGREISSRAPA